MFSSHLSYSHRGNHCKAKRQSTVSIRTPTASISLLMHFLCITCELCPSYSSCEIFLLIWLEQMGYITGLCFKYYHNLISVSDTRVLSCKQAGAQTQKCAHYCDDHTVSPQNTSNRVWMTMQQAQMVRHLHVQLLSTACVQCAGARGFEEHAVGAAAMCISIFCEERMHAATMQSI